MVRLGVVGTASIPCLVGLSGRKVRFRFWADGTAFEPDFPWAVLTSLNRIVPLLEPARHGALAVLTTPNRTVHLPKPTMRGAWAV